MALQMLRRNLQKLKWVLWFVILALSASMLLFFAGGPGGGSGSLAATELARVAGHKIFPTEFRRRYADRVDRFRSTYPQSAQLIKQMRLDQMVLAQLIREYAILVEGERLGIFATAQEVFNEIQAVPAFMENGQFIGVDRYRDILNRSRFSLRDFESSIQRDIVHRKLERVLTDGLDASDEEVRQAFIDRNQEVRVRYVAVNQTASLPDVLDEEELKAYYEENVNRYQGGEKRRAWTVRIEFRPPDMELSQEEVNEFLEDSEAQSVRVRHILIPIEGDESQARAQADQILSEVQGGADFAAKARELSKDQASASQGGELGFIQRGARDQAFEDAAFGLKPGQSAIARTPQGFHVIQQVEAQASLATGLAQFNARQKKARQLAQQLADQMAAEVQAGDSLEEVAQRHQLEVHLSDPFERGQPVPGATPLIDFSNQVCNLTEQGQLTDPFLDSPGRMYLAQLAEIIPPQSLNFEAARSSVEADYKSVKGRELAEQKAKEIADAVRQGADFAALARENGLDLVSTEFFKNDQSTMDDTLRFSPLLRDQAFRMEVDEVGVPVPVVDNFIAFQLIEKTPIDEEKLEQEKETLKDSLVRQKRTSFFNDYIGKVLESLESDEQIERNLELLEAIVG
ncbi:MAG: peptidylprolyl isomerase [Acidobacteriota bacterium]